MNERCRMCYSLGFIRLPTSPEWFLVVLYDGW